jgi:hypothetical protein
MMLDEVLFRDIQPIRSEVRVVNEIGIPVYGIGTVSLFVILKDGSIQNIRLTDCLYDLGLMKSLFSWSKLKCLNQYYLEDRGDILVRKIVYNEVILGAKECPRTHMFNIPSRTLEGHTTYTFWHKALGYPSHDLMKHVNIFSDSDGIPAKPKNFDCDSCLQWKSKYIVPKTLQDQVKSKFDIIYNALHRPLAVQSLGGIRYFVTFINEFKRYIWIYLVQHKSDIYMVFKIFYNLVKTQFSAKIKKLKTNNGGKYEIWR